MGDRLVTKDLGQKVGVLYPFPWGSWVPSNTNVAWAEAYVRIKWHLDPSNHLATIYQRYKQDNGPV